MKDEKLDPLKQITNVKTGGDEPPKFIKDFAEHMKNPQAKIRALEAQLNHSQEQMKEHAIGFGVYIWNELWIAKNGDKSIEQLYSEYQTIKRR